MRAPTHELAEGVVTADVGSESGGDVYVLIHGIGVSSRYFERLIPLLARRARVIAIDLPGFGRAPRPGRPYSIADFAAVTARTIDRLELGHCVVVGHSMGTQVATRMALERPDLVSRLVLIGPVMATTDRGPVRAALRLLRDTLGESPRANRIVLGDYLVCGPRWYSSVLPAMLGYRIEDDVPRVDVPVTVVRGIRDPISRHDWAAALAASARRGQFAEIAHARHLVMHAAPADTADHLRVGVAPHEPPRHRSTPD